VFGDRAVGQIHHRERCPRVAVPGLADAAGIDDDALVVDFVVLDVRVAHHEDFLLAEEVRAELRGIGVAVGVVGMAVDDLHAAVAFAPLFGEGGEVLALSLLEGRAGVAHAGAGQVVEREVRLARDGAVVVAHHRRHLPRSDRRDTLGVPGVVPHDIAGTQERVDGGHLV